MKGKEAKPDTKEADEGKQRDKESTTPMKPNQQRPRDNTKRKRHQGKDETTSKEPDATDRKKEGIGAAKEEIVVKRRRVNGEEIKKPELEQGRDTPTKRTPMVRRSKRLAEKQKRPR